ncbi:MAG TPA: DUF4860 domain-containing protein [Clostridiales bacterium]|nr:DUF4860 domain-containing protein [Clostridiales bacterium]
MKKRHIFQVFAVLCAVSVFALCVFYAVALSARVYRGISRFLEEAHAVHTGTSYISAKIHGSDKKGCVEIGDLDGTPALVLIEEIGGEEYVSYIYCFEGKLYELFCLRGVRFSPEDGMALLDIESLEIEKAGAGLIRLACSSGASRAEVYVALRSAGGGG